MKKRCFILLLIISMLTSLVFASADSGYWDDMKSIYEWDGTEGRSEVEITLDLPDEFNGHYRVTTFSRGDLQDFSSYMEIEIEDLKEDLDLPRIELYTKGSDFYINREPILALLEVMDLDLDEEIKEEYILFKNETNPVEINSNLINEILSFVENMDLGMEVGLVKEGRTYILELDADKMIDLFDAYMRYVLTNIDQLPGELMPVEIEITEEERAEALKEYDENVASFKDMAKEMLKGSYYKSKTTIEDDRFDSDTEIFITSPMVEIKITSLADSKKLDSPQITYPKSVRTVTEKELQEFILAAMGLDEDLANMEMIDGELKALIELDGSYMKFQGLDLEEGDLDLQLIDGRSYLPLEEVNSLLKTEFEGEDLFALKDLEDQGYKIVWEKTFGTISIYDLYE